MTIKLALPRSMGLPAFLCLSLFLPTALQAQEVSINGPDDITVTDTSTDTSVPAIVVTPSRTPSPLDSVPESVSIIDRGTMAQQGMVEVQDAVQDLPGVNFVRSPELGGVSSLFMRGTESSHTLVLLDGVPLNDPSDTGNAFNFGEDLLGSVDHVEVVQGPGSVMYGSNAIGGVINLISRQPTDELHTEANIYGGSYGTGGGEGLVSGRDGKLGYVMDVEGEHSDGFNPLPSRFVNNHDDPKGFDMESLFGKLTYDFTGDTRVEGQLRWRDLTTKLNDVPFDSADYNGQSRELNWQVRGEHDWLDKQAQTSINFGQTQTDRTYTNNPDPISLAAGSNILNSTYDGTRSIVNAQNDLKLPNLSAAEIDHIKLITGIDYAHESTEINYMSNGIYGTYNDSANASDDESGLFGELQGRMFKRVDLTAGLREDFPSDYNDHTTYRLGGVLQLPEIDGRIKSSFGTSFRTPSLFERYGVDSYGLVGNPNLKPETARSWDAGIEKDFEAFGVKKFASAGATYFETTTSNLIDFNFSPYEYVNLTRAEISGTESWIKARPVPWLEGNINWTYVRSINAGAATYISTPSGEPLLRRPQNTVSTSVTVWPISKWSITPRIRYVSSQYDVQYANDGTFIGRGVDGGYTLVDLTTNYKLTDHISAYTTVHNLFDRSVEIPNGYLQEPLTVMVGLKYQ